MAAALICGPTLALGGPTLASFPVSPISVGGEVPVAARQGRDLQRYGDQGDRLVAGCIPIRVTRQASGHALIEVLLITSRNGGPGLVFPKGGWEADETVEAAAARETVEEAGVRGRLETPMLGCFRFSSKGSSPTGSCLAHVFAMSVAEELEVWPESDFRTRRWVPVSEASSLCRHDWMRHALSALRQRWNCECP